MALTAQDSKIVADFRAALDRKLAGDPRFGTPQREDRVDGSHLVSRYSVGEKLWLEVIARPAIPQLKIGIMTDDRWTNEELEEAIEETGDTMEEFIESGFDEAGLDWPEPVVEHYRDQGKYFCFHTALDLKSLTELGAEATMMRVMQMLNGYAIAFAKPINKAASAG